MTSPAKPASSRVTPLDKAAIQEVPDIRRRGTFSAYAIAVALTLVAFALTLAAKPFLGRTVFLLFWPAVVTTAWLSGLGPALLASVGAVLLVDYYIVPPVGFHLASVEEIATFIAFFVMSALTSWAVSVVDRSRVAAASAAKDNAALARQLLHAKERDPPCAADVRRQDIAVELPQFLIRLPLAGDGCPRRGGVAFRGVERGRRCLGGLLAAGHLLRQGVDHHGVERDVHNDRDHQRDDQRPLFDEDAAGRDHSRPPLPCGAVGGGAGAGAAGAAGAASSGGCAT